MRVSKPKQGEESIHIRGAGAYNILENQCGKKSIPWHGAPAALGTWIPTAGLVMLVNIFRVM